ncbi:UPF0158 family protein [Pseudonocardia dioxanivorans]|uniref:UPF0158 family protein n=1 Tax=Pseudonocardia dioxanivorans TaxID=240495 RepID=UPI000CD11C48|nr:UPF0158 family protein [Pseudonocardia dioxanivorans]
MVTREARRDWLQQLRGAVYRGDGAAIVGLLATDEPLPVWQLIGDGVATALAHRVDGAAELAAGCDAALRGRAWIGDVELAEQLDGLAGTGPMPLLRPLAVDLDVLTEILEGDPLTTGGALDLRTGEVWPRSAIEYAEEDGSDVETPDFEDADRFRWADGDSRDGYRDMVEFIDTVGDARLAGRLQDAIHGRGTFRRFADTLGRSSQDELGRWFEWSDERKRGRARAWLTDLGFRVACC